MRLTDVIDFIWIAQHPCGCLFGFAAGDLEPDYCTLEEWREEGAVVSHVQKGIMPFIPSRCWTHQQEV